MPRSTRLHDTRDLLAAGLAPPARTRHTRIGIYYGAAFALWTFAVIGMAAAIQKEIPPILAVGLLILAATSTAIGCMLAALTALWRAMTAEHKAIQDDIKQLSIDLGHHASQVQALTHQVKAIDPWTIYSKVAGDLLGIKVDPGPM